MLHGSGAGGGRAFAEGHRAAQGVAPSSKRAAGAVRERTDDDGGEHIKSSGEEIRQITALGTIVLFSSVNCSRGCIYIYILSHPQFTGKESFGRDWGGA